MSKKTKAAKQKGARRRVPHHRLKRAKQRSNPLKLPADFKNGPFPGEYLIRFVSDQLLLHALKKTGIRDAFVKLLVKQLESDPPTTP